MTAALKTVLVDALQDAAFSTATKVTLEDTVIRITDQSGDNRYPEDFEADRLATAVRDYVFGREKVRAALFDVVHNADESMVDRLIEALAAGGSG